MFEILAIIVAIVFVPSLFIVHHMGFNKGYALINKEVSAYQTLNENEIYKINEWHRKYVYHVGSYPENWDIIRKINSKFGRNMFNN